MLREEMYLHQRSKLNWISYGDKNSAFFHATVTQRCQMNQLSKIKDCGSFRISEESDINSHLFEYFYTLFKSSGPRKFDVILEKVDGCVTPNMNLSLTHQVTDEEIKEAVFQLGSLESPGPDDFPGLFYQKFWDTVGHDVCLAVKCYFNERFLLRDLNVTNLVLIPKIPFPKSLSQYNPISLCNFSLKIITKVMAN